MRVNTALPIRIESMGVRSYIHDSAGQSRNGGSILYTISLRPSRGEKIEE